MATWTMAQILHQAVVAGLDQRERIVIAAAIAMAESGGNTTIVSPTHDVGLWQVNLATWGDQWTEAQLKDPATNAAAMVEISHHGLVWTDWSTFNNGRFRRFLPEANRAYDAHLHDPGTAGTIAGFDPAAIGIPTSVGEFFGLDGLAEDVLVIALTTVFTLAGLVLATLGLFQLAGTSPRKTFETGATVATGAGLAKTAMTAAAV